MSQLTDSPAWQALAEHHAAARDVSLVELFAAEPERSERLTDRIGGITIDCSRTHLAPPVHQALLELARQEDVPGWRDRMFAGERINFTEGRAALHAALRTPELADLEIGGHHVGDGIRAAHEQMEALVRGVHDGNLRGGDGGPITDIVHVGIGGSDLGPRLVCAALQGQLRATPRVHFVSNLDPADRESALAGVDPFRCLIVIASKTFTTLETLSNAQALFELLAARLGVEAAREHFVAVTASPDRAREWGIADSRILPLWDWIGGRYSLWSAIGLPVAFALGMDGYRELLAGAAVADRHFRDAPVADNLPLRLALIGIWYNNFVGVDSHAIVPYSERLALLPSYLQQLEMESNGKSVDRDGAVVDYTTAPAVWGQVGTTGQHAFFQWLHQGTRQSLCDLILLEDHADAERAGLAANGLAQAAALMTGRSNDELRRDGVEESERAPRVMPGNRPSVVFLLDELRPETLGTLIALHEHRVFCQAMLWRINPFDQWGVELGKTLARRLTPVLLGEAEADGWDNATRAHVARCRKG